MVGGLHWGPPEIIRHAILFTFSSTADKCRGRRRQARVAIKRSRPATAHNRFINTLEKERTMFKKLSPTAVFVVLAASLLATPVFAHDQSTFATALAGYDETPLTLNSPGSGSFV